MFNRKSGIVRQGKQIHEQRKLVVIGLLLNTHRLRRKLKENNKDTGKNNKQMRNDWANAATSNRTYERKKKAAIMCEVNKQTNNK